MSISTEWEHLYTFSKKKVALDVINTMKSHLIKPQCDVIVVMWSPFTLIILSQTELRTYSIGQAGIPHPPYIGPASQVIVPFLARLGFSVSHP